MNRAQFLLQHKGFPVCKGIFRNREKQVILSLFTSGCSQLTLGRKYHFLSVSATGLQDFSKGSVRQVSTKSVSPQSTLASDSKLLFEKTLTSKLSTMTTPDLPLLNKVSFSRQYK